MITMLRRVVSALVLAGALSLGFWQLPAIAAPTLVSATPAPLWIPNGGVHALASDGRFVYVGGVFTSFAQSGSSVTQRHTRLARISLQTRQPDPGWNPTVNGDVLAMAIDPTDSVLYIGGKFTAVNGVGRSRLAALTLSGAGAITSWNPNAGSDVLTLAMNGSQVVVGGRFGRIAGLAQRYLGLVTSGGAAVSTFRPDVNGPVFTASIPPAGSIVVVGGNFSSINNSSRPFIGSIRLADGATTTWSPAAACTGTPDPNKPCIVRSIAATDSDYYAAVAGPGGRVVDYSASSGARRWSVHADGDCQVVTLHQDVLYVGGHFGPAFGQETATALAAVNPINGALYTSWTPYANHLYPGNVAMVATPVGLFVGGDTQNIGHTAQNYMALFQS